MDPATQFFAKLKKVCVTLESETGDLLERFEKRHDECDTGELRKPTCPSLYEWTIPYSNNYDN